MCVLIKKKLGIIIIIYYCHKRIKIQLILHMPNDIELWCINFCGFMYKFS